VQALASNQAISPTFQSVLTLQYKARALEQPCPFLYAAMRTPSGRSALYDQFP